MDSDTMNGYALPEVRIRFDAPEPVIADAAGLYFRSVIIPAAGTVIGQHAHDHAHATFIGAGRLRGWKNGAWMGDKGAGEAFEVEAHAEHAYMTLEPNTLVACCHDIASAMSVKQRAA